MSLVRIENTSTEYAYTKVTTLEDPTSNVVKAAVVANNAQPSSYVDAEWYGTPEQVQGKYITQARVLIGTGSDIGALATGLYDMYVRIIAAPENIITKAEGNIRIY